jgi:hypothetical protein
MVEPLRLQPREHGAQHLRLRSAAGIAAGG